ncbi:hypothetical protein [Pseudomonas putida]|uniref:hypothetical protein n=1 Tax=Pseudomonas putida TaxID=303 RepID=UPI003D989692
MHDTVVALDVGLELEFFQNGFAPDQVDHDEALCEVQRVGRTKIACQYIFYAWAQENR